MSSDNKFFTYWYIIWAIIGVGFVLYASYNLIKSLLLGWGNGWGIVMIAAFGCLLIALIALIPRAIFYFSEKTLED